MILLLGATGYLGRAFAGELRKRQIEFIPLSRQVVDYTRFDVLFKYVRNSKPDLLINAAGHPAALHGDECPRMRSEMLEANTLLPQTVARVCYLSRTPSAHISSGSIFDGARVARNGSVEITRHISQSEMQRLFESEPEKFRGFAESDEPNSSFRSPPCSFYTGTKALAEEALKWSNDTYIWRPCTLFDEFDHPRNYLSRIQNRGKARHGAISLSHRGDFVCACLDLWERHSPFGTYNVVNPGAATASQVVGLVRRTRAVEEFSEPDEAPASDADLSGSACILDVSKLLSTGIQMRPLRAAIEESLRKWQPTLENQEWLDWNAAARK